VRLRKTSSKRRLDRITINLTSMIDVSFILLFYFLVASMLAEEENRLSTGLQTQSANTASAAGDFQTQVIEVRLVDNQPAYKVGERVCRDRACLAGALEPLPKTQGAFVKVYDTVGVGFAVAAVQIARDAGFEQVTYVPAK
jgi:biopolymer transport protein ExbD